MASTLGFGFNTGFSSSGGNIHAGCGLSGAFFFFFFFGGSTIPFSPMTYSGLMITGALGFLFFGMADALWRVISWKNVQSHKA